MWKKGWLYEKGIDGHANPGNTALYFRRRQSHFFYLPRHPQPYVLYYDMLIALGSWICSSKDPKKTRLHALPLLLPLPLLFLVLVSLFYDITIKYLIFESFSCICCVIQCCKDDVWTDTAAAAANDEKGR